MPAVAERVYRPDLYRQALAPLGLPVPKTDLHVQGEHAIPHRTPDGIELGPDRFLDGRRFDPADPVAYLASFAIGRHPA